MPERVARRDGPELVIGLVGAVGTDLNLVTTALQQSLTSVGYGSEPVRLSRLLQRIDGWRHLASILYEDERINEHMNAGNDVRSKTQLGAAVALLGMGAIRSIRRARHSAQRRRVRTPYDVPVERFAYILRSLKHPMEAEVLRQVYGASFVLVAAYAPRESRLAALATMIAQTRHSMRARAQLEKAERLNERDEAEAGEELGQNVRKTFPEADVFIDASNPAGLEASVTRFVELIFGHPFHTPTRDEYAMFHAEAAAMRSAALGRQVGAIIASESGDIVAVGSNEVPRAGGGLYWPGDEPDQRDFRLGYDTNERMKRNLIAEVFDRLKRRHWLSEARNRRSVERLVDEALRDRKLLGDAQVMNLLEFGRAVHAEMAAFIDAARRGVNVHGSSLYTTTFPCHECARHIVAAGVTRVVYVHPYPKSLAAELYLDSVIVDPKEPLTVAQVAFQPFVGVAPRMYLPLFRVSEDARKDKKGNVRNWERTRTATVPRASAEPHSYINAEKRQLALLRDRMQEAGMRLVG